MFNKYAKELIEHEVPFFRRSYRQPDIKLFRFETICETRSAICRVPTLNQPGSSTFFFPANRVQTGRRQFSLSFRPPFSFVSLFRPTGETMVEHRRLALVDLKASGGSTEGQAKEIWRPRISWVFSGDRKGKRERAREGGEPKPRLSL